jgi:hypothetical protein
LITAKHGDRKRKPPLLGGGFLLVWLGWQTLLLKVNLLLDVLDKAVYFLDC